MKISWIRSHLPALNVLALVVIVAMFAGPPAYSAGKRLITGADVADSSLTGADIQDGSITGADLTGGLEPGLSATKTWTYMNETGALAPKDVTIGNWGLRMSCQEWEANNDRLELWRTGDHASEPWWIISGPISAGDPTVPVTASGPGGAGQIARFVRDNSTDTQHIQVVTEAATDGITITASRSKWNVSGCRMVVTASAVTP